MTLRIIDEKVLKMPRKGDSCRYRGRRYYIKSIGAKQTVLMTVSEYTRNGLYGDKVPSGFRVPTSDISKIRYNRFNV